MGLPDAVREYARAQQALEATKARAQASIAAGQARVKEARAAMEAAIVADARAGKRMTDLVKETGLTREWIRRMLRRNGVDE